MTATKNPVAQIKFLDSTMIAFILDDGSIYIAMQETRVSSLNLPS